MTLAAEPNASVPSEGADEEADLEFSGQNEAVIFDLRHSRAVAFHRVGSAGSTP